VGWQVALEDERGFSLIELTIVIILMGIVFAIASSSWFGAAESRRVDSAANQLAADLRLAHTKATNQLVQQTVTVPLTDGSSQYTVTGEGMRDLDDDDEHLVTVDGSHTIVFEPNGEAQFVSGGNPITVIGNSAPDGAPSHTIDVNPLTSRVQID
jgi:prepilin-type N-terminal cleavage/methylation domain-containing protein